MSGHRRPMRPLRGQAPAPIQAREAPPQPRPQRRRPIFKFRKRYHLSGLQDTLFNATAFATGKHTFVFEIFEDIVRHRPAHVTVASLKGGRFKELARYDKKGTIKWTHGQPNQIGIGFTIDDKNNYVNIFSNGEVRFTGSSDENKVISFIEHYTGKLRYIAFSNRTGQLQVDKELNLDALAQTIDTSEDITVSRGRNNMTLHMKDLITISFYKSGVIQYKGSELDRGSIVHLIRLVLNKAQLVGGVFEGAPGPRAPRTPKKEIYKTTSKNPPDPPDSFEGKCPEGYYCRPNAQGSPSCYKIPIINDSSRNTVIRAYKGIKIPEKVLRLFKIEDGAVKEKPIEIKFEKQDYKGREVEILKVGGRQCSRMTEDQLVDVAHRNQIPGVKKGMGIAKMCGLLAASIKKERVRPSFTIEGAPFFIEGEHIRGAPRSNGKPNPGRRCATIPTVTLYKYAKAMGIDVEGKSKVQICKEMREKKQPERVVVVPEVKEKIIEALRDKNLEKFKIAIGTTKYTNANYARWLATQTPHDRSILIKELKLLETIDELSPGPFRRDALEYIKKHTLDQTKDYLKKLKETRERLKRGETEITAWEKETPRDQSDEYTTLLRRARRDPTLLGKLDAYEKKRGLGSDVDRHTRRRFPKEYWKSFR